jgi:hypothetical protein
VRNKLRWVATAVVWLAEPAGTSLAAPALDAEFPVCQQQVEALLRPDVDCTVDIRPGTLANVPQALQALIAGLDCKVPLRFRKAEVYGEWITDANAKSPDFMVSCAITAGGQPDRFSASARVECSRAGAGWSCLPVLHDVTGIGILGRALETYVNNNAELRAALTKALSPP